MRRNLSALLVFVNYQFTSLTSIASSWQGMTTPPSHDHSGKYQRCIFIHSVTISMNRYTIVLSTWFLPPPRREAECNGPTSLHFNCKYG